MCGSVGTPTIPGAMAMPMAPQATGGGQVVTQASVPSSNKDWTIIDPETGLDPTTQPIFDAMKGSTAGGGMTMPTAPSAPTAPAAPAGKEAKHEHIMIPRDTPENPTRAKKILKATMSTFGKLKKTSKDITFRPGSTQTHGKISKELRQKFKKEHPGMPVPTHVTFAAKGTAALGVMYSSKDGDYDLGLGRKHQHFEGGAQMQHVWFTPKNMDLAFADTPGVSNIVRAYREPDFEPSERVKAAIANGETSIPSETMDASMPGMSMAGMDTAATGGHAH